MKREIKFKGKRIDNGEWIYGMPIYDFEYIFNGEQLDSIDNYEVTPETVSQFTGLKDKNGVEIYEGDILKIDEGHPVEVRYENIYASFGIWRKGWAFLHYFHEAVEPENCEVIGNIHDKNKQKQALIDMMRGDEELELYDDNPELLK